MTLFKIKVNKSSLTNQKTQRKDSNLRGLLKQIENRLPKMKNEMFKQKKTENRHPK